MSLGQENIWDETSSSLRLDWPSSAHCIVEFVLPNFGDGRFPIIGFHATRRAAYGRGAPVARACANICERAVSAGRGATLSRRHASTRTRAAARPARSLWSDDSWLRLR